MLVCLFVFSIEIQTAGRIGMKFGMEVILEGERLLGGGSTQYPHPPGMGCVKGVRGSSGASAAHFGKSFIKTKVAGCPQFSGGRSPFWTPNPDLEGPWPHVLLEPWSLTKKSSSKIKVVVFVTNSYLVRLDTLYPDPLGPGGPKGGAWWGSGSSVKTQ